MMEEAVSKQQLKCGQEAPEPGTVSVQVWIGKPRVFHWWREFFGAMDVSIFPIPWGDWEVPRAFQPRVSNHMIISGNLSLLW